MNEQEQLLRGACERMDQIAAGVTTLSSQLGQLIESMNRNTQSNGRLILALAEGVDGDIEPEEDGAPQYLNNR